MISHTFDPPTQQPSFDVSLADLKAAYMKRMTELHPDRHTLKSQQEQDFFRNKASEVTRAYTILSAPHERAAHLMQLAGKPMDESSTVRLHLRLHLHALTFVCRLWCLDWHVVRLTQSLQNARLTDPGRIGGILISHGDYGIKGTH